MGKLHFTQIYLVTLGLSVLALLLNIELSNVTGITALALAVVILGLPHGALDFAVAKSLNYVTGVRTACSFLFILQWRVCRLLFGLYYQVLHYLCF